MKKRFSILMLCLFSSLAFAQDPNTNLMKYWHYRYRMVQYFENLGMKQGQSIPAAVRNGDASGDLVQSTIYWGDGPVMLGYYIGTLATEYRLLKDNHQDLNQTIMELYYALHAVYRLDSMGYVFYNKPAPSFPGLGYMLRDDIDQNWFNNNQAYLNTNIPNPSPASVSWITGTGQPVYVDYVSSDYIGGANDASFDNYSSLLMGLDLVIQLVDNIPLSFTQGNNTYTIGTGISYAYPNYSLYDMAKNLGTRILIYNAAPGNISENALSQDIGLQNAIAPVLPVLSFLMMNIPYGLVNPAGTTIPDARGGWPAGATVSHPLSIQAQHFYQTSIPDVPIGDDAWYLYYEACTSIGGNGAVCNNDNSVIANVNAATSNISGPQGSAFSFINFLENDNNSNCNACGATTNENRNVFYTGILQVLYPDQYQAETWDFCTAESILNSAPQDGPYNHGNGDMASYGWSSNRRFIDAGGGFNGNSNGLDYMLLYNIYCLMEAQKTASIVNVPSPVIVNCPFPSLSGYPSNYPYTYTWYPFCEIGDFTDDPQNQTVGLYPNPFFIGSCDPINVNTLHVAVNGDLNIQTSQYEMVDLNPVAGNILIDNGSYVDINGNENCCDASTPYLNEYPDFQYKRPTKNTSSPYVKSLEFDTLYGHDGIVNYPNPFTTQTTIDFTLQNNGPISIYITSTNGARVATLVDGESYASGGHVIPYNGARLAAGTYLCTLITSTSKKTIRVVKTK